MSDGKSLPCSCGQKALVIGIANEELIAYGCAKAFHATGADLAITWLNDKARRYVEPIAGELGASITGAVDVAVPGQLEAMFDQIRTNWGRLDILVHSIAFAPKDDLQGGLRTVPLKGLRRRWSFVPFLRSNGEACRTADDGRRGDVRNELLRRQPGGREL